MSTQRSSIPSVRLSAGRLFIVLIALALIFLLVGGEVDAKEPESFTTHRVAAGETLWEIAGTVDTDGSRAERVSLIRRINELDTSVLQIGQELRLPA